jgi:hypothetical protein
MKLRRAIRPFCREHSGVSFVLLLACSFSRLTTAAEAVCDRSLVPAAGTPFGYSVRGDRCEGLYAQDLASTTLEVASLIEVFDDYDLATAQQLHVTWTPAGSSNILLRSRSLKSNVYYRMDTTQPSDRSSYTWPAGILAALNLRREDLGVLAWTEADVGGTKQRLFVPLRISPKPNPHRLGSYRVVLLPGRELTEVYVSLAPVGADGRLGKFLRNGQPLGIGAHAAARPVVVPVPGPDTPGTYYLEIGADLAGGGVAATRLFFHHAGK